MALQELESGRPFQVSEVTPGVAVGHAHSGDSFLNRSKLVDGLEKLRAAVPQLHLIVENNPDFHAWFHRTDFIIAGRGMRTSPPAGDVSAGNLRHEWVRGAKDHDMAVAAGRRVCW